MGVTNAINLQSFYPESLKVTKIVESEHNITVFLKSLKHQHTCQSCGEEMTYYHGTYVRVVQDLPILGKSVLLNITAYEYDCVNSDCEQKTFVEDFNGFVSKHNRMTVRCEDFVKTLALQTSCEGAAMICKYIGIKVSGDTIIRILKKMIDNETPKTCAEIIGVDDFAYCKGQSYCTIICDGDTHAPVAVLEGRDGSSLREWLKNNKHVKVVTRDRASAYAKAIAEELPNAMQIADRFHLHQNLLKAIKDAINREIPSKIEIINAPIEETDVPVELSTDTLKQEAAIEIVDKKNSSRG